jgi:hypothetical protein
MEHELYRADCAYAHIRDGGRSLTRSPALNRAATIVLSPCYHSSTRARQRRCRHQDKQYRIGLSLARGMPGRWCGARAYYRRAPCRAPRFASLQPEQYTIITAQSRTNVLTWIALQTGFPPGLYLWRAASCGASPTLRCNINATACARPVPSRSVSRDPTACCRKITILFIDSLGRKGVDWRQQDHAHTLPSIFFHPTSFLTPSARRFACRWNKATRSIMHEQEGDVDRPYEGANLISAVR